MREYRNAFLSIALGLGVVPAFFLWTNKADLTVWLIAGSAVLLLSAFGAASALLSYTQKKHALQIGSIENKALIDVAEANRLRKGEVAEATRQRQQAETDRDLWKRTMMERNAGFRTLLSFIARYEEMRDAPTSTQLFSKKHPAVKSADIVREEKRKRRAADFENRRTQAIIEMYEHYAPFLIDLKDDISDVDDVELLESYSAEERQDAVVNYLTKEEYRRLPSVERNQLALDRFWDRPKSKWLIGKLYELYVGYLFEQQGFEVQYFGIAEKYEDMGRDLICRKGRETLIIQCKNWSRFKTIYEKHIFQLFGTVFEYQDAHPSEHVSAVFFTTTTLSPVASRMAATLKIDLFEAFSFDKSYPCIKCNINPAQNTRIYHLPFDQMYDETKISRKGEMYCSTVREAEEAGFRRAFRWRGGGSGAM